MRFEDKTTAQTRIKIMTDGILLQEMKGDPLLSHYSVIIVDEAHERSLNIDFILGLLKRVLESRGSFKVIISSATLNAEIFSEYFGGCPVVRIDTQMFPVSIIYDVPAKDAKDREEALLLKIAGIVERIVAERRSGDILVFLAGEKQIKDCVKMLAAAGFRRRLVLLPLYSRLSKEEQELIFIPTPRGKIKVIIATNIAETSVTIDGVTSVIDSGLAKQSYYNPRTYTASLVEGPISKSSCNQRRGRAGRTRPGSCYRLYAKTDFEARPLYATEEIFRTDLSEVVLRMAEIGITEFESFDFISPPGKPGIMSAVQTLFLLDALDADRTLSETGKLMVHFPLIPRHARMIVEAIMRYPDVIEETLIAASFLTGNSPFLLPQGEEIAARKAHHSFRDVAGDFVSYLNIFRAYEAAERKDSFCERFYLDERIMAEIKNVKEQLALIVGDMGIPVSSGGPVRHYLQAASRGLIQFVCARSGRGVYRSLTAERILIHPSSVMFRDSPRYIVAGEIVRTSRMYARSVSLLEKSWLGEISPALAESFGSPEFREETSESRGKEKPEKAGKAGRKDKEKRDTAWQVTLGGKIFELKAWKGKKKIAVLPWQDAARLAAGGELSLHDVPAGLRGKIVYNAYEIGFGENIPALLRIARCINAETDVTHEWPRKKNFTSAISPSGAEGRAGLVRSLGLILKLARMKKGAKVLGFLSLHTDGNGSYWFKAAKSLAGALETSLASLEALADELEDEHNAELVNHVNSAYRKLSAMLET
ncbi:MAG: ATP-dependent RNA helicase, partial [Spirochaetaceae bacterium]|nr:ATP-dependent RNA helicase [Spirochaetaceae bacterium]